MKGLAGRLHLPDAPSGCPKRSEGGSPATARRKCVRCPPYKCRPGGASKRLRRRQHPPPPVRYTGIAHTSPALTEPGLNVLPTGRRVGVLRRDIGDAQAVRACFPEAPSGCPKRSEGGFPATARRKYTQHRIQNIQRTTEDHHPSQNQNQKVKHKSPDSEESGLYLCAILGSNQ